MDEVLSLTHRYSTHYSERQGWGSLEYHVSCQHGSESICGVV